MSVRASRRPDEQGQALILALALLGLLSAFSVSVLQLASSSANTVSSVRETAYRNALREAGALMARQLVADGLGCNPSPMRAQFASETITVTIPQPPAECAVLAGDTDGGNGTVPADYTVCATVSGSGATEMATVKVSATQPNGPGTTVNVDIVRFTFGRNSPC